MRFKSNNKNIWFNTGKCSIVAEFISASEAVEDYYMDTESTVILVNALETEEDHRRKGHARDLMNEFIAHCREKHTGKPILLMAVSIAFGSLYLPSTKNLIAFYESFGFRSIKGAPCTSYMVLK